MKNKVISHSKPTINKRSKKAVNDVVRSGQLTSGKLQRKFIDRLKKQYKAKEIILTNSGTAALTLALQLLGIKTKQDEVILPSYVCQDLLIAIRNVGAKPVLTDIDEHWLMDPASTKKKLTKLTKAIILPHNMGIAADSKLFNTLGIPVIDDLCQSFGVKYNGKLVGQNSTLAVLSFNATKNITTGEGGALIINDTKILKKNKALLENYKHTFKFSDYQAALGLAQLDSYPDFLKKRDAIVNYYINHLPKELTAHYSEIKNDSVNFRFLIRSQKPFEKVKREMLEKGIHVRKGVDELLHRTHQLGSDKDFKNSVKTFDTTISLPVYPSLKLSEVKKVVRQLLKTLK